MLSQDVDDTVTELEATNERQHDLKAIAQHRTQIILKIGELTSPIHQARTDSVSAFSSMSIRRASRATPRAYRTREHRRNQIGRYLAMGSAGKAACKHPVDNVFQSLVDRDLLVLIDQLLALFRVLVNGFT